MIHVKVRKRFGEFLLDAELRDEGFICLAGKNGSGKSVLLNIVAGVYRPDEGTVITDSSPTRPALAKKIVLVKPDSYLPSFEVDKHLLWGAKLQNRNVGRQKLNELKEKLGIKARGRVSKLSLGMRERVALGTALLSSPKVVLVDEAFANIDNKEEFIKAYREYARAEDIDVIFSTQQVEDGKLADHLYVMDGGRATRNF